MGLPGGSRFGVRRYPLTFAAAADGKLRASAELPAPAQEERKCCWASACFRSPAASCHPGVEPAHSPGGWAMCRRRKEPMGEAPAGSIRGGPRRASRAQGQGTGAATRLPGRPRMSRPRRRQAFRSSMPRTATRRRHRRQASITRHDRWGWIFEMAQARLTVTYNGVQQVTLVHRSRHVPVPGHILER